ncbi:DNA-binding protein [Bacillus thuringiensis]|uniref:DNA-binding protein n=1 Tax=Bacillus thuringiensis TaxID=1428 RepID=UPI000BF9BAC3|nr:DNA-binding protein [Bacillus thuringiensis]PFN60553.1 DNA-binding protein [Bacillus thuringiensis]
MTETTNIFRYISDEERQNLINFLNKEFYTTAEVLEKLELSKQRLQDYKRTGKLEEIKKGIFLKKDVLKLRIEILKGAGTIKYNTIPYDLTPVFKDINGILIINTLRLFDCCAMISHATSSDDTEEYSTELSHMLDEINKRIINNTPIYFLYNKDTLDKNVRFDTIETTRELYESRLIKSELSLKSSGTFTKKYLEQSTNPIKLPLYNKNVIEFLESYKDSELGLEKVGNFNDIYKSILKLQNNYNK